MKTTLELPDELMRRVKIRAASTDRKLKETIEELIQRGLDNAESGSTEDPLLAFKAKLIFHTDGSVSNPDGIEDAGFFEALEEIRAASRREAPNDPFA